MLQQGLSEPAVWLRSFHTLSQWGRCEGTGCILTILRSWKDPIPHPCSQEPTGVLRYVFYYWQDTDGTDGMQRSAPPLPALLRFTPVSCHPLFLTASTLPSPLRSLCSYSQPSSYTVQCGLGRGGLTLPGYAFRALDAPSLGSHSSGLRDKVAHTGNKHIAMLEAEDLIQLASSELGCTFVS